MKSIQFVVIIIAIQKIFSSSYYNTTVQGNFVVERCERRVNEIKVPSSVTNCLSSLYVFFSCDGQEHTGFLSKDLFIRNIITEEVVCSPNKTMFLEEESFSIELQNKEVLVEIMHGFSWKKSINFSAKFFDDINDLVYLIIIFISHLISVCIVNRRFFKNLCHIEKSKPKEVFAGKKADELVAKVCGCKTRGKRCGPKSGCSCLKSGVKCSTECHNGNKLFDCCNPNNKNKILKRLKK